MEHDNTYMYIHKGKSLQKSVVRGEGVVQGGISQHIIWLLSSLPTTSRKSQDGSICFVSVMASKA